LEDWLLGKQVLVFFLIVLKRASPLDLVVVVWRSVEDDVVLGGFSFNFVRFVW
jgi:hypothetical protein